MKETYNKPVSTTVNITMESAILAASRLPIVDGVVDGGNARSNHSGWSSEDWSDNCSED